MINQSRLARWLIALALPLLLISCGKPLPELEQVKMAGELVVLTSNDPTTYYEGPQGLAGPEYELVSRFAKELGVRARFIVPDRFEQTLPMLRQRRAHLAAAGLTITEARQRLLRFTHPYQHITEQVVYRRGEGRPRTVEDLLDKTLEVVAGSSHEERLQRLKFKYPSLSWTAQAVMDQEQLLMRVANGDIDYAVADSNSVAISQRYYPQLSVAFDLTPPEPLAWAFNRDTDDSLYQAAQAFFERIEADGTLDEILERYYGYVERLDFVDKRTFWRHVNDRLPKYKKLFQRAAAEYGFDWHLLAAIGYQESHWNPKAVSPTGVRGIMMLTQDTARQVGIDDRNDPEQSIIGGAMYLQRVLKKIPLRIKMPDRLWFALAGYNIGFGHLEDARVLTERQGADPDKWLDVRERLPLLSQKQYYKTVKHGYARGQEPVNYVANIRNYYDLLLWRTAQERQPNKERDISWLFPSRI